MIAQIEILTKLAENGIIAAAFLYILYWLLNKQSSEMEAQSKHARQNNLEIARAVRSLASAVMGMQQQLLAHDLTVTGLNPSTGANFEERDSMAYKRYTEVMQMLEEQRSIIREINKNADQRMDELRAS